MSPFLIWVDDGLFCYYVLIPVALSLVEYWCGTTRLRAQVDGREARAKPASTNRDDPGLLYHLKDCLYLLLGITGVLGYG